MRSLFGFPFVDRFDDGFTLKLSDGWMYTVENEYTGFSVTFPRKNAQTPFFDENGVLTDYYENEGVNLGVDRYFVLFKPVDADGDGVFEVMTAQYTYLYGRLKGMGTAYTLLKWDGGAFKVVKAGYWVYADYDGEEKDEYLEEWRAYEDEWYR